MCQLFVNADPSLWETRLRSVRMHGFSTSVRLEKVYWALLEEIARRDGLSLPEILARERRRLEQRGLEQGAEKRAAQASESAADSLAGRCEARAGV